MANTTNFNWETPDDTDLVKDGAAAIRTLGNSIDTSFVDLKGGTTGQILSKSSNTDLDYTWITNDVGDITNVGVTAPITGGGSSGSVTIGIDDGTTTQKGAVQLEDSTSSTSTTKAATPNSVKTAYDLANAAIPKSLVDAAGDLIYATADNTVARLALGTAGKVLTVNSGATAPEWATPASSSGPVARAYRATTDQNIGQNTFTKVELNAEDFDTDSCYDPTTNYRFTPNKAGKYLVTVNASYDSAGRSIWAVYKNGTAFQRVIHTIDGYGAPIIGGACMVDMNGTTDYLEIYALMVDAGTRAILNSSSTGTSATFSFVRS